MDPTPETTSPRARPQPGSERSFLAASAMLFAACAIGTVLWTRSMAMPGGSTPALQGQGMGMTPLDWLGAGGAFVAMWLVMMAAMMLPSLAPALLRYRRAVSGVGEIPLGGLTALAVAGYFSIWVLFGLVVFPLGAVWAAAAMQSMALSALAPFAPGAVLLLAGGYQLTAWKARQLNHCRNTPQLSPDAGSAWRHGITLGVHCSLCCLGFMAVLLVNGVMDLGVMGLVAAAITFERLVAWPERAARITGVLLLLAGVAFIARALGVV